MEDLDKPAGAIRPSADPAAPEGSGARRTGSEDDGSSIREQLRARRAKASRRIGESWQRASAGAKEYADDHSIGVALGSLGVGIAAGLAIGIIAARD